MEKPPKKRDDWISRAQARDKWLPLSILGAALAAYVAREGSLFKYSHGLIDTLLGILTLVFIAWCLWPSDSSGDEPDH